MPHSSGGGSHSGGSHSGGGGGHHSSSSSSRSSSPPVRVDRNRFPGAYRYVKDNEDGTRDYIYSDSSTLGQKKIDWFWFLFYIPFLAAGIFLIVQVIHMPQRMDTDYPDPVTIIDALDMVSESDEALIEKSAGAVYDKTGVPVCIEFKDNDIWKGFYRSLEEYAYDKYIFLYSGDENRWLIVYTDNGVSRFTQRSDWCFEGMQGDNTDEYLPEVITWKFNKDLTKALRNEKYTTGQAFAYSFDKLAKRAGHISINLSNLPIALFWNGFILLHMFVIVFYNPGRKYKKYRLCPGEDEPDYNSDEGYDRTSDDDQQYVILNGKRVDLK